jgi:hypothetical protein
LSNVGVDPRGRGFRRADARVCASLRRRERRHRRDDERSAREAGLLQHSLLSGQAFRTRARE